jgi:glycosyltransferase involved in cell wall biosynthesis
LRNSEDLAKKMIWMLEHQEEAKALGVRAREAAVQRFNIDDVARQHEELYSRVIEAKKKSG